MASSKTFTSHDQAFFTTLSGDFNPIHTDALAARRTVAGALVVHGVHVLLWLLDQAAGSQFPLSQISALSFRFRRMVYVGDTVEARLDRASSGVLRIRGYVGGTETLSLSVAFGEPRPNNATATVAIAPPRQTSPSAPELQRMAQSEGTIESGIRSTSLLEAFPQACRVIGATRVAALCCSSYLVGMVVPGLNSIYQAGDLQFLRDSGGADLLRFKVASVDLRFGRVTIEIAGNAIAGSLIAAVRTPPVMQPSTKALASQVGATEFSSTIAMIVGGSRGLGEATAKLLAIGGAQVIVTYAIGESDAQRVAADIAASGGAASIMRYDVREDTYPQLEALSPFPTHLYYFATPPIVAHSRLHEFNQFYLHGFLSLIHAARRLRPEGFSIFYPSTVYVERRPPGLADYAMSKAAGEVVCADVARLMPEVRVVVERLPRVLTDQTAAFVAREQASAVDVMLPILRRMHPL